MDGMTGAGGNVQGPKTTERVVRWYKALCLCVLSLLVNVTLFYGNCTRVRLISPDSVLCKERVNDHD